MSKISYADIIQKARESETVEQEQEEVVPLTESQNIQLETTLVHHPVLIFG